MTRRRPCPAAPGPVEEAARALAWGGPDDPGGWTAVVRTFRDGHAAGLALQH